MGLQNYNYFLLTLCLFLILLALISIPDENVRKPQVLCQIISIIIIHYSLLYLNSIENSRFNEFIRQISVNSNANSSVQNRTTSKFKGWLYFTSISLLFFFRLSYFLALLAPIQDLLTIWNL